MSKYTRTYTTAIPLVIYPEPIASLLTNTLIHGPTCAGSLSEVLRKHLLHNDHVNVGQE